MVIVELSKLQCHMLSHCILYMAIQISYSCQGLVSGMLTKVL